MFQVFPKMTVLLNLLGVELPLCVVVVISSQNAITTTGVKLSIKLFSFISCTIMYLI